MRRLILLALAASAAVWCQTKSFSSGPHRMEITLERMERSEWRAIDPGLVLDPGDRVRFRFRANFDGYLYVMNHGTTGSYSMLFPREETGRENTLKAGREYLVPATQAWFRVAGPPGYDVVYWLVSPVALGALPPAPKKAAPLRLVPRCDDAIFRARGDCVDSAAGPRAVTGNEELPENLAGVPGAASRELIIMRQQKQSLLSSPVALDGPVVYEFRLAHK